MSILQSLVTALVVSASMVGCDHAFAQQPSSGEKTAQDPAPPRQSDPGSDASPVVAAELGNTKNVHRVGDLYLAGQFGPEDISIIKSAGVTHVITLRPDGEIDWDEKRALQKEGLGFETIGFRQPDSLTDDVFDQICQRLKNQVEKTLLHCGSANRVGAVWMAHRVLAEGVSLETAQREAHEIGLKNPAYELRALAYIRSRIDSATTSSPAPISPPPGETIGETSVRPGINDNFLSPDLDPAEWIKRFEIESREVYSARNEIVRACKIQPGDRIADIGSGTGIYTRLFARHTGPQGWVYSVDISPRLLAHVAQQSATENASNVTAVLCQPDSTSLPPASIDLAFICDTYHHFEYPQSTLASLHAALKPGGRLVLIDFKRIEGKTRPWLMDHVRAGQEVFTAEITDAGFELLSEEQIPGLEENYFLVFTRN